MIAEILHWMDLNRLWLSWLGAASFVTVLGSMAVVPLLIVRMQPDYFLKSKDETQSIRETHPFLRGIGLAMKNTLGALLIVGGILMTVLPGQGLLTILIGLALMDFPAKRKLEIWIIKRKPVAWSIRKIREKANRPPLVIPV